MTEKKLVKHVKIDTYISLNDIEVRDRTIKLTQTMHEADILKEEGKRVKRDYDTRVKNLEDEVGRLRLVVHSGKEHQTDIPARCEYDFEDGVKNYYCEKTNVLLRTDRMDKADRQLEITDVEGNFMDVT